MKNFSETQANEAKNIINGLLSEVGSHINSFCYSNDTIVISISRPKGKGSVSEFRYSVSAKISAEIWNKYRMYVAYVRN